MLAPLPLARAASVLSQPKQNHSICFFLELDPVLPRKIIPWWEGWGPAGILSVSVMPCVGEGIACLPFQKVRRVFQQALPFSILPWPQRDLSRCGPGGRRELTSESPDSSWGHQQLPFVQEVGHRPGWSRNLRDSGTLEKLLQCIPASRAVPLLSVQRLELIPGGQGSLSVEGTQIHVMLRLRKKINQALLF